MTPQLFISQNILSLLLGHFAQQPETPCGGFLLGVIEDNLYTAEAIAIFEQPSLSKTDFIPDPVEFTSGIQELGTQIIAVYHNHPSGKPEPTLEDILLFKQCRQEQFLWVIFGKLFRDIPYARAFHYHPSEEALIEYLVGTSLL